MKKNSGMSFSLVAGILFVVIFSCPSYALEIGARGYYWFPTLNADMKVDGATVPGTHTDIRDDLGVGNENYPSIEVFAGLGKHRLSLMYTEADHDGNTVLAKNISFNGATFPAGTAVASDFKYKMLDLAYQYDLIRMKNMLAGCGLGVIGKIKYIEAEASMSSGGVRASETVRAPIPMIGLGVNAGLIANILEARASVTGIAFSNNHLYEAAADISLTPLPFIDIHGGYRIIKIRVDEKDVFFNSDISGPYLALTVSF